MDGCHYNHQATTRLTRPDGTWIQFPVLGRRHLHTVMIAQDQNDAPLAYFRKVRAGPLRKELEIVVTGEDDRSWVVVGQRG